MKEIKLKEIDKFIKLKKIDQAQAELSKLGSEFHNNFEYLFLRSKIFYLNKLYYLAIDTLLIASEFEKSDKIYHLLGEIYKTLGNGILSEQLLDSNSQLEAINSIKDKLTGIYKIV